MGGTRDRKWEGQGEGVHLRCAVPFCQEDNDLRRGHGFGFKELPKTEVSKHVREMLCPTWDSRLGRLAFTALHLSATSLPLGGAAVLVRADKEG